MLYCQDFESMRICSMGVIFQDRDNQKNQKMILYDSKLAEGNWPDQNPVGKKNRAKCPQNATGMGRKLSVVEHVSMDLDAKESGEQSYIPYSQRVQFH